MSRLSAAVRRIHWGKLAAGASAVVSSGVLIYAFPQYAPVIGAAGALLNLVVNPTKPEASVPVAPVAPALGHAPAEKKKMIDGIRPRYKAADVTPERLPPKPPMPSAPPPPPER